MSSTTKILKIIFKNRNTLWSNPGKGNISPRLCPAYFTLPSFCGISVCGHHLRFLECKGQYIQLLS